MIIVTKLGERISADKITFSDKFVVVHQDDQDSFIIPQKGILHIEN